jgi:hypothetical protein
MLTSTLGRSARISDDHRSHAAGRSLCVIAPALFVFRRSFSPFEGLEDFEEE